MRAELPFVIDFQFVSIIGVNSFWIGSYYNFADYAGCVKTESISISPCFTQPGDCNVFFTEGIEPISPRFATIQNTWLEQRIIC